MMRSVSATQVFCPECGRQAHFEPGAFRCACGGAWEPTEKKDFAIGEIDHSRISLWRYQRLFGLSGLGYPVTLGAGWTPLLETDWQTERVKMKLEYFSPTGSFKDRGVEVEMNVLSALGIKNIVEDSSGNAGASLSAYAARLGMRAEIYVPQDTTPAKMGQIAVFGARLIAVPGARLEATQAALSAVRRGVVYASHAYNPFYLLGQQSIAWEIWEQLEYHSPDALVIPVGQGGLLMGAWLGFKRLLMGGQISKMPRLFAVQPERLAPVALAYRAELDEIPCVEPVEKSAAEGLAIVRPVRANRLMQALRESGGSGLTVTEAEIFMAVKNLALNGFFVEPSSAVAAAALPQVYQITGRGASVVVALTGSGLKSPTG